MPRHRGRSPDEFYVSGTPSWIDPPGLDRSFVIRPVVNEVIVRSRGTGIARAYMARNAGQATGSFVEWVNRFVEDLGNGLFE